LRWPRRRTTRISAIDRVTASPDTERQDDDAHAASSVAPAQNAAEADARWLDVLNRICGRAAHELKGALNGVSVNVEVMRSRAEKPDVPASSLKSFASAASSQLDAVIEMADALLGLTRAAQGVTDVAQTVRRIVALLGPAARVEGKVIEVDGALDLLGATPASGTMVRLAVGEALLAALDKATRVCCVAHGKGDARPLRIERSNGNSGDGGDIGDTVAIDDAVLALIAGEGIHIEAEPSAMVISFPR